MSMRKRRIVTTPIPGVPSAVRPRSTSSVHITSPLDPISPWPPILTDEPETDGDTAKDFQHVSATPASSDLPTAKEIYGSIAVLLTGLGYVVYLAWAFLPPRYLDAIGWTWYPARDWALIIPCYLMLVVLLAYLVYAGLTVYLTPPFDAAELVTDRHAHIPAMQEGTERYYWTLRGKDTMPPAVDLPIDVVNRTLYPPRPRPDMAIS